MKLVFEIKNTVEDYKKLLPMVYYIPLKAKITLLYNKFYNNSKKYGEIVDEKPDYHKVIIKDDPEYHKKELDKLFYSDIKTILKGKKHKDIAESLNDSKAKKLLNRIKKFGKEKINTMKDFTVMGKLNQLGFIINYRLEK